MALVVFLSTARSMKEGQRIGEELVKCKLAACVNVIPGALSFFIWDKKIRREKEVILLIKSEKRLAREIIKKIQEIHSYSIPEGIYLAIDGGERKYLDWAKKTVKGPKRKNS